MPSSSSSSRGRGYRAKTLLFAGGVLAGLVAGELFRPPPAQAQIPDPAAQRIATYRASLESAQLLKQIRDVLTTGTLKVEVVEADKARPTRSVKPAPKR